jgi:hypothetical protein
MTVPVATKTGMPLGLQPCRSAGGEPISAAAFVEQALAQTIAFVRESRMTEIDVFEGRIIDFTLGLRFEDLPPAAVVPLRCG